MRAALAIFWTLLMAGPALADRPVDRQLGFQAAATPIMEDVHRFHDQLLIIIAAISFFVLCLLVYVVFRYNKSANRTPSTFTHNTLVEIVWTGVPVLILLFIAVPSFKLLYKQDVLPPIDVTIKAVGYQWYWGYEYPDSGGFDFSSYMLAREDITDPRDYLLAVDAPMVAPAGKNVRVLVTAADVIHAWTIPAFGVKMDGIPGRTNETWFRVDEPGTYYGQCSELCGKDHAYMPIQVEIVSEQTFAQWSQAMSDGDDTGAARVLASYKSQRAGAVALASAE